MSHDLEMTFEREGMFDLKRYDAVVCEIRGTMRSFWDVRFDVRPNFCKGSCRLSTTAGYVLLSFCVRYLQRMNIPTYFNTSLLVLNVMFMHISLVSPTVSTV
jgi:hypothetical protein